MATAPPHWLVKGGRGIKKEERKKDKIKNIHSAFVIAVDLDPHPPWQAI